MRILYIYNKYTPRELDILEEFKKQIPQFIDKIDVSELEEAKKFFHIRETPAILVIRDDFQGAYLTNECVDNKLFASYLIAKEAQEEEKTLFDIKNNRLDNILKNNAIKAQEDLMENMVERGVL